MDINISTIILLCTLSLLPATTAAAIHLVRRIKHNPYPRRHVPADVLLVLAYALSVAFVVCAICAGVVGSLKLTNASNLLYFTAIYTLKAVLTAQYYNHLLPPSPQSLRRRTLHVLAAVILIAAVTSLVVNAIAIQLNTSSWTFPVTATLHVATTACLLAFPLTGLHSLTLTRKGGVYALVALAVVNLATVGVGLAYTNRKNGVAIVSRGLEVASFIVACVVFSWVDVRVVPPPPPPPVPAARRAESPGSKVGLTDHTPNSVSVDVEQGHACRCPCGTGDCSCSMAAHELARLAEAVELERWGVAWRRGTV